MDILEKIGFVILIITVFLSIGVVVFGGALI